MSSEAILVKETGLPDMTAEANKQPSKPWFMPVMLSTFLLVGYGIASAIYSYGSSDVYDKRIATITTYDLKWLYLSAFIWTFLVIFLNFYPMQFKSKVMLTNSGNLRSNMFIYKLAAEGSSESAVVLNNEGDIGMYNRGNRSLYHFVENSQPVLIGLILNSFVFPYPTFIVICVYALGRVLYAIGYTNKGYGGHVIGFVLDRICLNVLLGQFLLIFIKA